MTIRQFLYFDTRTQGFFAYIRLCAKLPPEAKPTHATDRLAAETEHDPKTGQFAHFSDAKTKRPQLSHVARFSPK